MGLDPSVANGSPVISTREQEFVVNNVAGTYLVVEFQRSLLADGVAITPELSTTLASGSWQPEALVYVSTRNNGDGTATVIWRSAVPVTPSSRMFVRLRVE